MASAEELSENYSRPARYERERAIHERTAAATLDYKLIEDAVDYERITDLVEDDLVGGLKAQVRFVYRAAKAAQLDPEKLIEDAVKEAEASRLDVLADRFQDDPQSLTLGELRTLRQAGRVTNQEYEDAVEIRPPIGHIDPDEYDENQSLEELLNAKTQEREDE
jgi:hypothetical protein